MNDDLALYPEYSFEFESIPGPRPWENIAAESIRLGSAHPEFAACLAAGVAVQVKACKLDLERNVYTVTLETEKPVGFLRDAQGRITEVVVGEPGESFEEAVDRMRKWQQLYFKTREKAALQLAKDAERDVDRMLSNRFFRDAKDGEGQSPAS